MDEGTRDKWALVTAPVILGILADALLRALPWGLNVFIWVSLLAGFIIWATHDKTELWTKGGGWLVLPSVFFAAGFLWRDSQTLGAASLFALWVTASLAVFRAQGGHIFAAGLADYTGIDPLLIRLALIAATLITGPVMILFYLLTGFLAPQH